MNNLCRTRIPGQLKPTPQNTDYSSNISYHHYNLTGSGIDWNLWSFFESNVIVNSDYQVFCGEIEQKIEDKFDIVILEKSFQDAGMVSLLSEKHSSLIFVDSIQHPLCIIKISYHYEYKPDDVSKIKTKKRRSFHYNDSNIINKHESIDENEEDENILHTTILFQITCKRNRESLVKEMVWDIAKSFQMKKNIDTESFLDNYRNLTFVYPGSRGIIAHNKTINRLALEKVRENYPQKISEKLEKIIHYINSGDTSLGHLIVLHGDPGTGKTFSIRSIIGETNNTQPIFYLQPYQTLQDMSVIMESFDQLLDKSSIPILIFEDIGETLQTDNKSKFPQITSHLLNLTEGFFKHLVNTYIIVTFNQKIKDIDPALTRPGRCAFTIEFTNLSYEESKHFLEVNKIDADIEERDYTLAELYAIKNGNITVKKQLQRIGF